MKGPPDTFGETKSWLLSIVVESFSLKLFHQAGKWREMAAHGAGTDIPEEVTN